MNSNVAPSLRGAGGAPLNLDALERRCRGTGWKTVCRHPDIDDKPLDHADRVCVLDLNEPNKCEFSSHEAGAQRIVRKTDCQNWRPAARREPQGLDPETALRLIDLARASPSNRKDGSSKPLPPQTADKEGR